MLVIGRNGQLARALAACVPDATFLGREQVDITDADALRRALEIHKPDVIINAAAYTAVDKAQSEEPQAYALNETAPKIMADYAAQHRIPFVHISTDYVFDGSGDHARTEDETPSPLNVYGASKLAGEKAVQAAGGKPLIFRTSWVYDALGTNFLNTMLRLGAEREQLRVVADQIGAPSYAPHLARAMLECLGKAQHAEHFPSGVYHLCNAGLTSWHGFAQAIFESARKQGMALKVNQMDEITSDEYPTPAMRPKNSRLSCDKLHRVFGVALPDWTQGLDACMEKKLA